MLRRHGYAACGLVALLGVAGCTGGGGDPPVSTSTTSATLTTSSPSTTTTATTSGPADGYPAAARAHTVEGGKAFVEYYYATLNQVLRVPKGGVLPDLGVASCEFCKNNEKLIGQLIAGDDHYDSDPIQVVDLAPIPGAPTNQQYYSATSAQVGAWILDSTGKKLKRDKQVRQPVSIAVVWGNGVWRLYGADRA